MAYEHESKEARTLKAIQSKNYPDTNKDFVKNISRLNSSVDYISSYMNVMQKGIDDANKNIIEQLQGILQDIWVLFAGGEPTGFDIGDVKYIFMALGALFGFSGRPFPYNVFDMVTHLFDNFLSLIPQFTDVIFDTIFAWADALGVDPEFTGILRDAYDKAIEALNKGNNIIEALAGFGGGIADMMGGIAGYIFTEFIQPIIDFISRAIGGGIGGAISTIMTNIGRIFGLASGADSKATLLMKKAVPLWESLDGNGETSFPLATADVLMNVNATNSRGAFISCAGGSLKQTISCIVSKTGTVNSFNLDVYKLNASNEGDLIYTSSGLSSSLISGVGNETVLFHILNDDDAFETDQNSYYFVMARMTGSGSVNIQGKTFPVANTSTRPLYSGVLRDPTASPVPNNIPAATLDSKYVRDTPYFQLGSMGDITPQSFYFDFSALTTNLWYFKRHYWSGVGEVQWLTTNSSGYLYMPSGGPDGLSAITHKFNVSTDRCRVGMKIPSAPTIRPTIMYMFSRLDMSNFIGIGVYNDSTYGSVAQLHRGNGINDVDAFGVKIQGDYVGKWIWLEYDPTEGKFYFLVDPNFNDPAYRNTIVSGGAVAYEWSETSYTELSSLDKSSTSRSGGIVMVQGTPFGGFPTRSTPVDDFKLEDYPEAL